MKPIATATVAPTMSLAEARQFLLELAEAQGIELEVVSSRQTGLGIKAFGGGVDEFKYSTQMGLGLRVLVAGAWGHAFTERLDPPALRWALATAIEHAELVAPAPHAALAAWPEPPVVADIYGEGLSGVTMADKVAGALTLEQVAKAADPRVASVPYAFYQDGEGEFGVANSAGLARSYRSNYAAQMVAPLVMQPNKAGGVEHKMKFEVDFSREFSLLDPTRTALVAVEGALALLGAEAAPSGHYPTVIEHRCMASLLLAFASLWSGQEVEEGKSLLAERLGSGIASPLVTLVDDATLAAGRASRPFDSEGYPSARLLLVEAGVLTAFMHSSASAARAGVTPTGHAARASYKDVVGIAPSNFYLEPGPHSREALLAPIEAGLYLTALQGMHAGVNPITGDFSLQAEGFWIEHGQITHPLAVFTVAGNFLGLLGDIEAVGNDPETSFFGATSSPSVRVKSLSVGGG
jgi:PmbA protein